MPSLRDLADNLSNFRYYSGVGSFDANKLPFGKDLPGGGNSGQPYIVTKPGFRWSPNNFNDGIIAPGGAIAALTHTGADVLRISKFFTDAPKGPLFLAKQVGLQLMNPLVESRTDRNTLNPTTGQGIIGNIANGVVNTVNRITNDIGTTRIYNPLGTNTIAQVAGSALGLHVVRHGTLPVMNEQDKYLSVVKRKEADGNNRLTGLAIKFADQKTTRDGPITIASYMGGSDSFLGIGKTTISSAGYTTTLTGLASNSPLYDRGANGFIPIGVDYLQKIDDQGIVTTVDHSVLSSDGLGSTPVFDKFDFRGNDFRKFKNRLNKTGPKLPESNYEEFNMPKRIGTINRNGINSYAKNPHDDINMVSLYYGDAIFGTNVVDVNNKQINDGSVIRDLIKFRIKILDNDSPTKGTYLIFRAFFNGEINEDISNKHNAYTYVGRGEQFYTYESTVSVLTFSFTIVAFSKEEMKPLYQKLNYLKASNYPDYKNNKMRGTIAELTIGDYIRYQPGIINNMNITIPETANWEIAIDEPENGTDKDMHELPQMLRINMTFTPVYSFLPRRNSQTPFIGINDLENGRGGPKDWLAKAVEPVTGIKKKK